MPLVHTQNIIHAVNMPSLHVQVIGNILPYDHNGWKYKLDGNGTSIVISFSKILGPLFVNLPLLQTS